MESNQQHIASWTYSSKEWDQFVTVEKKNKLQDNIYLGIGIVIVGTIGLMFIRDTSFWIGLLFSLPIAIIIPVLRMVLSYKHLKKGVQNPQVEVFKNYLLINGKKIETQEKGRWLKSVKILDPKDGVNLLQFEIEWKAGKGKTGDEYRIPIPKNQTQEAERVLKLLG